MRNLIISTVLLILTVVGILCNSLYINNVGKDLLAQADSLPPFGHPSSVSAVAALRDHWERIAVWVSLSANHNPVDRVGEQIDAMEAATLCGDLHGYHAALALFRDALEDLLRPEGLQGAL